MLISWFDGMMAIAKLLTVVGILLTGYLLFRGPTRPGITIRFSPWRRMWYIHRGTWPFRRPLRNEVGWVEYFYDPYDAAHWSHIWYPEYALTTWVAESWLSNVIGKTELPLF